MTPFIPSETRVEPLAQRVDERRIGPVRLLVLPTPVQDVVSLRGSIRSLPDFAAGEELTQSVLTMLLDKGTRQRDRFAAAEVLEDRGAQLRYGSNGLCIGMEGRALRGDLPVVLGLLVEQLREPLLEAAEFEKARRRYEASLKRTLENTQAQASSALARRLYGPAHPNYSMATQEALRRLTELSAEDVQTFHARHVGANDPVIVLVGDVTADEVEPILQDILLDWTPTEVLPAFDVSGERHPSGRTVVDIPGKMNVDVRMGLPVALQRQDDAYLPLHLGNFILGGNFSARLMTRIRDELGLTYGIRSSLNGVTTDYRGHWQVSVTLSAESLEPGIAATQAEVQRFVDEGPTEEELRDVQTTIIGSFTVRLATTGGLASALHRNAVRGFEVGYLDAFPDEVAAVTLGEVREAVARHITPASMQTAIAGTPSEATDPSGATGQA